MEKHEFGDIHGFVEEMRVDTLELLKESKNHADFLRSNDKETFDSMEEVLRSASSIIIAGIAMRNPMVIMIADDIIEMVSVMFWIGHYLGSVPKTEMPEVFKKYWYMKDGK